MSTEQIIRAWKDANYRQSLSEEEQALVPAHPAGSLELSASVFSGEGMLTDVGGNCTAKTELPSSCFPPNAF